MHRSHPPSARGPRGPGLSGSLLLLTLPLALAIPQPAFGQVDPDQRLPLDPAVTVGTLENGLRFYVRVHREPRNRAELRLVVNAGSVLEDPDQRGLAHFLEHMAFNGTENFERQALVDYLESIGMRFGPDLNAYTSFDETVYMLQLPTDDPEILDTGFRILEEWAHRITLDPEEVEKERGVILEEWRLGRGAQARVLDQQVPVLFEGSLYAERLPIGDTAVIRSAPVEALERFYRDWYRPDLMAVVAVGDFDAAEVEAAIRERFSRIPRPPDPRPRPDVRIPPRRGTGFSIVSDPELPVAQVAVAFRQPPREEGTVGAYRRSIVEALYRAMLNFRLQERTREEDPPFLGAASVQGRIVRQAELYQLAAAVQPGGVEAGLEALLVEAERVARAGFTPSELSREKEALLRRLQRALDERERRPSGALAAEYVRHFLTGEPIPGIEAEFELVQSLLPTIGLEEVNALGRELMYGRDRVILVSAPDAQGPLPSEESLLAVFGRAAEAEVAEYAEGGDEVLMAEPPLPGRITAEVVVEALEARVWTLSNGARVIVRPTDFRDDEVLFQAWAPGGISLAPDELLVPARTAAAVVGQGGIGELSLTALQRVLAGRVATVTPSIGEISQGMSGAASIRDLETLFQLIHLHFTAPRRDPGAFQALRAQLDALLANRDASPQAHFQDTLAVTMAQGHPRARPIGPWYLERMDLDASLDFYRERFADASGFTFVFVGTLDPDGLRPLVERYLASLPATGRGESWRDDGVRPPSGPIRKVVRKGLEPQSLTQLLFTGEVEYTDRNRDLLGALAQALEIRLRETLREGLGGTYGVSVSGQVVRDPRSEYTVGIAFGSDPRRVEELLAAVQEEILRLQHYGPLEEDMVKVREAHRRSREVGQRQNAYWLQQLLNWSRYDLDPERITAPSLWDHLTSYDLREAARRFLRMDNVVVVTLLPESDPGP